ncbi:hypothetical protein DFH07DRAFT_772816 [Mycena maculata]|uniref:Uncharacterized protein n=1 Tax=Mycena maculata TaxID=230809 RepID=A0AAD7J547_9AGAR|nr:hypothetical protein DFH07DRAFT_772816 [Mycena maculata]
MRVFAICLWYFSLLMLASAVLTNHTIDDQAPAGVTYIPAATTSLTLLNPALGGPHDTQNFNPTQLFNGTVSYFPSIGISNSSIIEVNFTGNAIYVFAAVPSLALSGNPLVTNTSVECQFLLDRIRVGGYSKTSDPGIYNVAVYANSSIPDGPHSLRMVIPAGNIQEDYFAFDYAVYTSDDPDPTSIGVSSTSSNDGRSTSTSSMSSSSVAAPFTEKKKKMIVVGAVVGGIGGLFNGQEDLEKETPTAPADAGTSEDDSLLDAAQSTDVPAPSDPAAVALPQELRTLTEGFERYRQHAEGSSTTRSETASVRRSLSVMKRDQTLAVLNHQEGYALVHTDSGLRLSAGRPVVDELPPTYTED